MVTVDLIVDQSIDRSEKKCEVVDVSQGLYEVLQTICALPDPIGSLDRARPRTCSSVSYSSFSQYFSISSVSAELHARVYWSALQSL